MGGWRGTDWEWRGLLVAVLLSGPALAQDAEAGKEPAPAQEPVAAASTEPAAEASAEPVAVASAQPVAAASAQPGAASAAPAPKQKEPKVQPLGENLNAAEELAPERTVRVFGRVFARASADEREEFTRSLSLPSARVGVSASFENIEAEVTADLSSKNMLKDAFVRLANDSKSLRLYGGHFKAPFLARELESTWELPLMRRGLVDDYLTETHQIGGRRLGLMGEVRLKEMWNLRFSGGLFEGAEDELGEPTSEDASARVSVRPFKALTLGASSYLTQVLEGTKQHAFAADASLRLGGLELSGEVVTGRIGLGPFLAQLGLLSYALPVSKDWAIQPLVGAEAIQLRGELTGRGWAAVGGVNLLFSDSFKAQLQAERALRPGDKTPGTELSLQLATRF